MDTVVQSIMVFSQNQDGLAQLPGYLKTAEAVLASGASNCLAAAQALEPSLHSLGMVVLLNAHARKPNFNAGGDFVQFTSHFLCNCAAQQIQQIPEPFVELCRRFKAELLGSPQAARLGVLPLREALQRLAPSPAHLTPLHADVLQLCLLAKTYNAALPLLEGVTPTEADPSRTGVGPTDVLLYAYYGGMVATGRKQLGRALELFLQGLTAPTLVCSAIAAACYKKYVLVSLMHSGSVRPLPRFTSPKVRHLLEFPEVKPYSDLAAAYAASEHSSSSSSSCGAAAAAHAHGGGGGGSDRLLRVAEQHMNVFSADNNVGLVKQVLASKPVRTIQRLTQTYVTLPLADIARAAGLQGAQEAEDVILRMVSCGQVFAQINGRDGMVTFLQDPQQYNSADVARRIDGTIRDVMSLSAQVQAVQDAIVLDKAYASKLLARERGGGALGALTSMDADYAAAGMFA